LDRVDKEFKFEGFWWYYDRRENPFGDPEKKDWFHYEDHISVLLERGFYTWLASNKQKKYSNILVSPEHMVDFEKML